MVVMTADVTVNKWADVKAHATVDLWVVLLDAWMVAKKAAKKAAQRVVYSVYARVAL